MELPPESAALLVEFGADSEAELDELVARAEGILGSREPIRPPDFTRDGRAGRGRLDRARGAARADRAAAPARAPR